MFRYLLNDYLSLPGGRDLSWGELLRRIQLGRAQSGPIHLGADRVLPGPMHWAGDGVIVS